MRATAPLVLSALLALGACAPAATAPAPTAALPAPTPVAAAGAPVTSPGSSAESTSPAPSFEPTDAEAALLHGMRLDLQGSCAPLRTGLPGASVAGVECRPGGEVAGNLSVYAFDARADMLDAYFARLVEGGVATRTNGGRCEPDRASEGAYTPGDGQGPFISERGACFLDEAGAAHYLATLPPFVLFEVAGQVGDVSAVERWAWLGNQDQPGSPTIWATTPRSPEK